MVRSPFMPAGVLQGRAAMQIPVCRLKPESQPYDPRLRQGVASSYGGFVKQPIPQ